jgi:hypothetical protein
MGQFHDVGRRWDLVEIRDHPGPQIPQLGVAVFIKVFLHWFAHQSPQMLLSRFQPAAAESTRLFWLRIAWGGFFCGAPRSSRSPAQPVSFREQSPCMGISRLLSVGHEREAWMYHFFLSTKCPRRVSRGPEFLSSEHWSVFAMSIVDRCQPAGLWR